MCEYISNCEKRYNPIVSNVSNSELLDNDISVEKVYESGRQNTVDIFKLMLV